MFIQHCTHFGWSETVRGKGKGLNLTLFFHRFEQFLSDKVLQKNIHVQNDGGGVVKGCLNKKKTAPLIGGRLPWWEQVKNHHDHHQQQEEW